MPSTVSGRRTVSVTVQQRTVTKGASHAPVETWTTLRTLYVSKEDMPLNDSRESFKGSQLSARMETAWGLPYSADTDPDLVDVVAERRILHNGRIYDVTRGTPERDGGRGIILYTIAKVG